MKKLTAGIIIASVLAIMAGCSLFNSDSNTAITSLSFEKANITVAAGEVVAVTVKMEPADAQSGKTVEYSVSSEGYFAVSNTSSHGAVITGLRSGSAVLIAKCDGRTAYLEVLVSGTLQNTTPYIIVPTQATDLAVGARKTLSVSLFSGTAADNSEFTWAVDNAAIATIQSTSNTVVVTGMTAGTAKITVSHPDAPYPVEILVFVYGIEEAPLYITSSQNVMTLFAGGVNKQLSATLVGGSPTDNTDFTYAVTEGSAAIDLIATGGTANITPKAIGVARVRITHPKAADPLDVLVFVTAPVDTTYIELDQNLVVLTGSEGKMLTASFIGAVNSTAYGAFSYSLSSQGIVNVVQVNNSFYLTGVTAGTVKLIISNGEITYPREVLVIVQDQEDSIVSNEYYITTSQNIVQLELGSSAATLNMVLVGGNEADKNNFTWTIDDSSIATVETTDGTVRVRSTVRSLALTPQNVSMYTAKALITPKAVGTTKIEVSHPKATTTTSVIVKVYPSGTFKGTPNVLTSTTSLYKVLTGGTKDVTLTMLSGTEANLGNVTWSTAASGYATVVGTGLTGLLQGVSSGVTDMTVTGDNLLHPYNAKVIVGDQATLDTTKAIYADNIYPSVATGEVAYIEIKSNGNALNGFSNFTLTNSNQTVAYARMAQHVLIVQALAPGQTEITVSNPQAANAVTLFVSVTPAGISIDKPYYFTGPDFIGIVKGQTKTATVSLVGAPAGELTGITWEVDDSATAKITGNGENCNIEALAIGQTYIHASHAKSYNTRPIVVFVANTAAELTNAFVMSCEKKNYLLTVGQSTLLKIDTYGSEAQKANTQWTVDDASILSLDTNNDSAYVTANQAGNAVITITNPASALSLKLYVSVITQTAGARYIEAEPIVELVAGQNRKITTATSGLTDTEIAELAWSSSAPAVATVTGSGGSAYVGAKAAGEATLTISSLSTGLTKRIIVIVAATQEELAEAYVLGVSEAYYSIAVGETRNLSLVFGKAGFPESAISSITWASTNAGIIEVVGNGKTANAIARGEGTATITASSPTARNSVQIAFTVRPSGTDIQTEGYSISVSSMIGVLIGQSGSLTANVKDKDGNTVTSATSGLSWTIDDESVATILANGASCQVTALKAGQAYITITHPEAPQAVRVLVYTALTSGELASSFPLSTNKENYLLQVGESVEISVGTASNDTTLLSQIKWAVTGTNAINYSSIDKKTMRISGKAAGNSTITVTHPGATEPVTFYVSVVASGSSSSQKTIITESIIGIVRGNTRSTTISTNLSDAECTSLTWSTNTPGIATVSGSGKSATISALATGEALVTVQYSANIKRSILVYVCDTQAQVDAYSAMNIDNVYRTIPVGGQITLSWYGAPVAPAPVASTVWTDLYGNNVVRIAPSGKTATITGLNEGMAVVRVTHPEATTAINVVIEVSKAATSSTSEDTEARYITATKLLYVLDPANTTTATNITVTPVGFSAAEAVGLEWTNNNPDIVSIYPAGGTCQAYPNREGRATITVTHPRSLNMLTITLVVGPASTSVNPTVPYVNVDKQVVTISSNTPTQVTATLVNVAVPDNSKFNATVDDETVAGISMVGNLLTISPRAAGQALVTISHPGSTYTANVVVVVDTQILDLVYLTTADNYSVVEQGSYKTLSVSLVGYNETNGANIVWTSRNPEIATITGSGSQVIVNGVGLGTARITVTHPSAPYPLDMYVRVTNITNSNPTYITTQNNIVTTEVGDTLALNVALVNGSEAENSLFQWSTANTGTVQLNFSGNTAVIKGLTAGNATITVSHPSSLNSINIVVMVEDKSAEGQLYITTDSTLVQMKPTDAARAVAVRLVGGKPEDIYGFNWEINSQYSAVRYANGTSKEVVKLVANADNAYFTPVNEGEAIIRVTHPLTNYKLDIRVQVTLYNAIKFGTSNVTIDQGTTKDISMEVPTTTTVVYESSNSQIAGVTGTSKVCIIEARNPGIAVITARSASGNSSDELVVQVNAVQNTIVRYIECSTNLLTLTSSQSATAVNATAVGPDITAQDQGQIVWTSTNTAIVTTYGAGKTCSITPRGIGDATIELTHTKIPGYKKILYVRVVADDVQFTITDISTIIMEGEQDVIGVSILGVSSLNYLTDVVWANSDSSVATMNVVGDGSQCIVVGKKVGTTTLSATYKSMRKTCTVVVTQRKTLSISSTADVVPGQVLTIPYTVTPEATVTYAADTLSHVSIVQDAANKNIKVTGLQSEGYTVITLSGNGLSATCTVHTAYNYYFRMSQPSLRGTPNQSYTIQYVVSPSNSNISASLYDSNLMTLTINQTDKTVTVTPKKAGYSNVKLTAAATGTQIDFPVYFYYTNMPVPIAASVAQIGTTTPWTNHSSLDEGQLAIHLADGEKVTLKLNTDNGAYPNNGVLIGGCEFATANNSAIGAVSITTNTYTGTNTCEIAVTSYNLTGNASDMLRATNYAGTLSITYTVPNGGIAPETKKKTYLVYVEQWRRR